VQVTYNNLTAGQYASALRKAGLDEATARFTASVDSCIAQGELQTSSTDLANLLGHPALSLGEAVRTAHALLENRPGTASSAD
jgi:NAD(P)H dehydrogenase (quinone)